MKTLALVLSPFFGAASCVRRQRPLTLGLAEEVRRSLGRKGDREEDEDEDGGGEPGLALGETDQEHRGRHQPDAAERGRRGEPHRLLAVAGLELALDPAGDDHLDAALEQPGRGGDRVAEQRQTGHQKDCKGGGEHAVGRRISEEPSRQKAARLGRRGRTGDYIRMVPRMAL